MEREHMKAISYLRIPRDQKPLLATKWHNWRTRRAALDKILSAAFKKFNQSLPSHDTLPDGLLAALERYLPDVGDVADAEGVESRGKLTKSASENEESCAEQQLCTKRAVAVPEPQTELQDKQANGAISQTMHAQREAVTSLEIAAQVAER